MSGRAARGRFTGVSREHRTSVSATNTDRRHQPPPCRSNSTPIGSGYEGGGVQIVGYETVPSGPDEHAALVLAEDGAVSQQSLAPGTALAFTLGDRHCAGALDAEGHRPCDAPGVPYCDRHTSRWACARCTGGCDLPLDACHEEHAVYLAAFAPDAFKVGVTRSWRLDTRLREQGADRAAHLRTVVDGRVAREIEAEIAVDVGDRIRVPRKIGGLGQTVDGDAWSTLRSQFDVIETYAFDYGLDLAARPMAETMATGTVLGTKGRILVLERAGSTYAVDLRDLVGHEVTDRGSNRELQSSLGAFE